MFVLSELGVYAFKLKDSRNDKMTVVPELLVLCVTREKNKKPINK